MSENNIALVSRCMRILSDQVGIVDTERFIYLMRSEAFDYTKWQREYYDKISPDELDAAVDRFSAENRFSGERAKII